MKNERIPRTLLVWLVLRRWVASVASAWSWWRLAPWPVTIRLGAAPCVSVGWRHYRLVYQHWSRTLLWQYITYRHSKQGLVTGRELLRFGRKHQVARIERSR